ncbi:MAG: hypothetical protein GF400_06960, partial [Candidatus Eisenbacteria bacterium]|nr:hypothetical protein [Candidatus Eisenbacteria bacterium]
MQFLLIPQIRDQIRRNFDRYGKSGLSTFWKVRHRRGCKVLGYECGRNLWHDDGEEFLVKVVFTEEVSIPANFYIGLDARASLAEADSLSSLSGEPSGNN